MIFKSKKQIAKDEAVDIWERIVQYIKDNEEILQDDLYSYSLYGIKQYALINTKYVDYLSLCSYCDESLDCDVCIGVEENAFTPHGDKCWTSHSRYYKLMKLFEEDGANHENTMLADYEKLLSGSEELLNEFKRIADNKPEPLLKRFIKVFKKS